MNEPKLRIQEISAEEARRQLIKAFHDGLKQREEYADEARREAYNWLASECGF